MRTEREAKPRRWLDRDVPVPLGVVIYIVAGWAATWLGWFGFEAAAVTINGLGFVVFVWWLVRGIFDR